MIAFDKYRRRSGMADRATSASTRRHSLHKLADMLLKNRQLLA